MESGSLLKVASLLLLAVGALAMLIWNMALRRRLAASGGRHIARVRGTDSAAFGCFTLDADGRFIEINDTALRWLGCTRDAAVGKLGFASFLEGAAAAFTKSCEQVRSGGGVHAGSYDLVSREGTHSTVIVSLYVGGDARVCATAYDITSQVRASRALGATLEHTPSVAVQWFDRDGRVRYWNNASASLFGWRVDEATGRTLGEIGLYTEAQGQDFIEVLREIDPAGGALDAEESTFFRKDGAQGVILSTLFPIPGPLGEPYVACMAVDVTERHRSEEQLRATLENTPGVAVQWYDAKARVLYWNSTSEMFYGIDAEDALGRRMDELLLDAEQYREFVAFLDGLKSVRNTADSRQVVVHGRHGVDVTVLRRTCMIPGERGEPIFVCMEVDLTDVRAAEREREQLDIILSRVTEAMPVCLSYVDNEHRYVWTNSHNAERLGTTPDQMIGRSAQDVYAATAASSRGTLMESALDGESHYDEREWRRADGELRTYDRYLVPDKGDDGNLRGFTSVWVDITERKEAEHKIRRLNRVHTVLSSMSAALVRTSNRQDLFDSACRIAVNEGGFGMAWVGAFNVHTARLDSVAWAGADLHELRVMETLARDQVFASCGLLANCLKSRTPALQNDLSRDLPRDSMLCHRASELGYRSVIFLPLSVGDQVAGVLGMMSKEVNFFTDDEVRLLSNMAGDVAFALEAIDRETRINYLAYYDMLTGLPNRTLFHERLGQLVLSAKQRGLKLALLVVDIRRFRYINETLGRQQGDFLLQAVADRFLQSWTQPDYVGRLSGVHFGLAATSYDNQALLVRAIESTVVDALKRPFMIDGREVNVSCAAGVSVFPEDGIEVETLFKNAEAALAQAKAAAEPYMFYRPQMNERMVEGMMLENRMRRALEREQFVLHYQPKVDLAAKQISGFEALLRWDDPEEGLVAPGQFIQILEETGMIVEVGQWAMRRVLQDRDVWQDMGLEPPRIAVNVSAIQLLRRDFTDQVRALLEQVAPGGKGLDFEITESMLLQDIEGSIQKLRRVRDMGVNIAIDDFGTGYSSLAYLSRLPVNALKIDQSFVRGMLQGGEHMSIVSTIISLAHAMQLKVIAEGVETREQLNVLRSLGCDEAQGYFISRPVPEQKAAKMLRDSRGGGSPRQQVSGAQA